MAERVFIGIGSNMGNKEDNIKRALEMLSEDGRISVGEVAPLYRTEPVGYQDQDWFLNTVAVIETVLPPHDFLTVLMDIENKMGRKRTVRWGPRVIDLDILLYGDISLNTPDLQVPHPRMLERAFVVAPLADLHPEMALPGGRSAAGLAAELSKSQHVERYTSERN